jgi:hypothetical protein
MPRHGLTDEEPERIRPAINATTSALRRQLRTSLGSENDMERSLAQQLAEGFHIAPRLNTAA